MGTKPIYLILIAFLLSFSSSKGQLAYAQAAANNSVDAITLVEPRFKLQCWVYENGEKVGEGEMLMTRPTSQLRLGNGRVASVNLPETIECGSSCWGSMEVAFSFGNELTVRVQVFQSTAGMRHEHPDLLPFFGFSSSYNEAEVNGKRYGGRCTGLPIL